jgi:hypothetical protein
MLTLTQEGGLLTASWNATTQDLTFEVNIIGPTTQAFDNLGTSNVTVFAVDDQGNVSEGCETTLTLNQRDPIARCSTSIIAQLDQDGEIIIAPSDLDSLSSNGGVDTISLGLSFGSSLENLDCAAAEDETPIPVTLVVTNSLGRSDECVSLVMVQDTVPPVLICRQDTVEIPVDPETGIARFRSRDMIVLREDNCGFFSLFANGNSNFSCGDVGRVLSRTVSTNDRSFNRADCEVTITITDPENFCPQNTAPVAVCNPEVTIQLQPDRTAPLPIASVNDGSFDAETQQSSLLDFSLLLNGDPFSCADVDLPRTVELIVTDPLGLSDTCSSVVTVIDPNLFCDDAPVANCQETLTVTLDENGNTDLTPVDLNALSSDAETPDADPSGNSSDCSFTVRVEDNEPPQAMDCPADTTLFVNADSCRLSFAFAPVQFVDNCSNASILFVSDNLNGFEIPGQLEQLGFDVTAVFEDYVDDDTEDNTLLQGDLSSFDMIYWNASGERDTGDSHSQATTDNLLNYVLAGGHLFVTGFDAIASPDDPNLIALLGGSGSVDQPDTDDQIYTVLGPENNLNSGLFDIIGLPIPPIGDEDGLLGLNAETIVVVDSDVGDGARWALRTTTGGQIAWVSTSNSGAGSRFPQWETPGSGYFEALRNFAFNNLRATPFDGVQTAGPVSGSSFELGTTTLTFTGTDRNGNDAACSYNVTVLDTISPLVVCRDTTIALDADGIASLSAEDLLVPSTVMMVDNCPFNLIVDQTAFTCADVGDNLVVLTATDDSGNTGSCTATVTVTASDLACDAPPVAICIETLTIELDEDGNTNLTPADLDNGSSDAVTPDEDLIFSFDPAEGLIDCDDIGTLSVSLIVTDNIGQTDTCFTQVTVEDNIAPEAICQDVVFELRSNRRYTIVLDDILNSILTEYTDNCGELNTAAVVVSGGTNFSCGAIGPNDKSFFFENDDEE